jgi:hypothetical protein
MKSYTKSLTVLRDNPKDTTEFTIPPFNELTHDTRLYFNTLADIYVELKLSGIDEVQ